MKEKSGILDRARVASPCPANWEEMKGSDRARLCDLCDLHVYNISEMTRSEAEALIAGTEGRLCVRLYRRADGSVMTKDCPVGLRAVRVRAAKVAGTVFAALLSLCTGAFAQHPQKKGKSDSSCTQQSLISREKLDQNQQDGRSRIVGTVVDPVAGAIPEVKITIKNEKTGYSSIIRSDADGNFQAPLPEPGKYTILFEAAGFASYEEVHVAVQPNEALRLNVTMLLDGKTVTVGIFVSDPEPIETEMGASGSTTTIRPQERRIP